MKYLGIDYGEERTGLALGSDETAMTFAFKQLNMGALRTKELFFGALIEIMEEEGIEAVVVGMPLPVVPQAEGAPSYGAEKMSYYLAHMNLAPEFCKKAKNFVLRLRRRVNVPVYLMDEAYSSCEAEEKLLESGLDPKRIKESLDSTAASLILQSFLNLPCCKKAEYEYTKLISSKFFS